MIDGGSKRQRIVIVGAGFRGANNFLPALRSMSDEFEICGIYARSTVRSGLLGKRWDVRVLTALHELDADDVDVVAVSVPTDQNRSVFEAIARWKESAVLLVDTPVAWNLREYRSLVPLLRRFKAVFVAEDFMNLPQFALARRAAEDGLVGKVRNVFLFNTGYRYHGLALLRSFTKLGRVVESRRTRLGSYASVLRYRFAGGMNGYIVGPYRQTVTGGIVVEGDEGIITESPEDANFADIGKRKLYTLKRVRDEDTGAAFVIENSPYRIQLPEVDALSQLPFEDRSPLNIMKIIGLKTILRSTVVADELNAKYGFENALYDSFASRLATAGLLPFDPLVSFGRDFMYFSALTLRSA